MTGKFIVLEGIDGSGTTTQAKRISQYLEKSGLSCLLTAEPTEGPIGNTIRGYLSGQHYLPEGEKGTEIIAMLFAADRLEHLDATIIPALEQGKWVISDRYVASSMAYQGGDGVSKLYSLVQRLNARALRFMPDLTIFLTLDAKTAGHRVKSRKEQLEIYEKLEFQNKLDKQYRQVFIQEKIENLCIVEGQDDIDFIFGEIKKQLKLLM